MFDKLNKKKAFTLVELVIVVAIIGILISVAVPKFKNASIAANNRKIEANSKSISTSIMMFYLNNGKYPNDEDIKKIIKDDLKLSISNYTASIKNNVISVFYRYSNEKGASNHIYTGDKADTSVKGIALFTY